MGFFCVCVSFVAIAIAFAYAIYLPLDFIQTLFLSPAVINMHPTVLATSKTVVIVKVNYIMYRLSVRMRINDVSTRKACHER